MTLVPDARVHHDNDRPLDQQDADHHLIICRDERIVFHDRYEARSTRLSALVALLTGADIFTGLIDAVRADRIHAIHSSQTMQWTASPDDVINDIAKACREWGLQIYVSSLHASPATPERLFSIITEYNPGQIVAEHFTDRASRTESLVNSAEHFFSEAGHIPEIILGDDQRLAALIATFLMPARVSLVETAFDSEKNQYRPAGQLLPVR